MNVPGQGNPEPNLMIVGHMIGKFEADQGKPFVGPSGTILNTIMKGIGHEAWRSEAYVTNIVKDRLPEDNWKNVTPQQVEEGASLVRFEIKELNPSTVLVLGKDTYDALGLPGKFDNMRGTIQWFMGRKFIAAYHPARFLYSKEGVHAFKPYEKAVMQHDIMRAWEESTTRSLELPRRTLQVVEDSNQFLTYLNRWDGRSSKAGCDIESINFIPFCISFAFHPLHSISIPLFDGPLGKTRSPRDKARLWIMIDKVLNDPRIKKIGQNFKYDEPKLRKLSLWLDTLYSDIMLKCHAVCPEFPRNLAFLTSIHTREPFYKNEYEEFKTGKTSIQDFMLYNAKDSAVTIEIDEVCDRDLEELGLTEFYYEFVMQLHYLYLNMEDNGIPIDENLRKELLKEWAGKQAKNEIELYKILGDHLNTNSFPQVQKALTEKLKLPKRDSYDENTMVALLGNHAKKPEQKRTIELILENRRVRRLLSTTLSSPADYDGKMRTSVFIPATETRRTADDILGIPIRPFNMGIGFKTLSKHGEAGAIRKMFVPGKGFVFINFDQSQAEARVCSLLADDEETLKNFDTIDIHAKTASWAFGGTWETWSKAKLGYECPERFIGKTLRHAGHLDMQKRTCMLTINTDAKKYGIEIEVSEYKAGKLLETFHAYTPKIRSVFHEGIREALLRDDMFLTGSSPCVGKNWFPKRQFYGDWDRDLWKEGYSFIPQQSVSDKTKWILLQLQPIDWIKIVGESHDAGLLIVPEGKVDECHDHIKHYGEQPIDFSRCSIPRRNLVIPIDVEIGKENYKDLKKYKKVEGGVKSNVSLTENDLMAIYRSVKR